MANQETQGNEKNKIRWHWQYAGAIALYVLNVDWIIMPKLKFWGLSGWLLFVVTSVLAVLELYLGYLFWDWFRRVSVPELAKHAAQSEMVQEAIEMSKEIQKELKKVGLWEKLKTRIINFLFNTYKKATDHNNRFMKWLKRGGNIGMFAFGINPEPGTRTFGAIFCGTTSWRNGLYPLALGNIFRVAYMVGLWEVIFRIFK